MGFFVNIFKEDGELETFRQDRVASCEDGIRDSRLIVEDEISQAVVHSRQPEYVAWPEKAKDVEDYLCREVPEGRVLLGGGLFLVAFLLLSFGPLGSERERRSGIEQRFVRCRVLLPHCAFNGEFTGN